MLNLYVAPNGDDTWSGTLPQPVDGQDDGPFATLERARNEIRRRKAGGTKQGGVTVHLRGGCYALEAPFSLEAEDSGAKDYPVTYRAYQDETVKLSGGKTISNFQPVTDPAVLKRLPESARDHVRQACLREIGITDTGEVVEAGRRVELFFNDVPMQLARWPNEGFVTILDVTGGKPFTVHGISGDKAGVFTYEGDRPARWKDETDIRLHGYWFWDWADAFQRVVSIDTTQRIIELEQPYHNYGYRPGQRYYALNLLSELNSPGEWYLDREQAILYFWPPHEITPENTKISILPSLITVKDAAWITFHGLTLESTRSTAATIEGGDHVRIAGCVIRNTGSWAVRIDGGDHHGVIGCDIHQTGEGGVILNGGDRPTLIPAAHYVENNHIHGFGRLFRTYRPAVNISGVGNRIAHNRIHDGPHNAIQLHGNDHVIEYNEIYDVCYETGDVGAFYMGRDWTERGIVIRHNYFHDIQGPGLHGAMAVYLDDAASGITVYGNVFYRAARAAFIGGGRDNVVENNIFVACDPSVHVDARGLGWMRYHVEEGGIMPERLAEMPCSTPLWRTRYPRLIDILDKDPGAPTGNRIIRNISLDGAWSHIEDLAEPLVEMADNLIDEDPKFVDKANLNFRLREDSPAWKLGFKDIPFEKIGLYEENS